MPLPTRYIHVIQLAVGSYIPMKPKEIEQRIAAVFKDGVKAQSIESPSRDLVLTEFAPRQTVSVNKTYKV